MSITTITKPDVKPVKHVEVLACISREQIVAVATRAIELAEEELALGQREDLMRIAHTETLFLGEGWWSDEHKCGCLVGHYRRMAATHNSALRAVGFAFDRELFREVFGKPYDEYGENGWPMGTTIIRVVD